MPEIAYNYVRLQYPSVLPLNRHQEVLEDDGRIYIIAYGYA